MIFLVRPLGSHCLCIVSPDSDLLPVFEKDALLSGSRDIGVGWALVSRDESKLISNAQ